ncbi:ferritin [Chitinophaga arvensicola]|uniref:Ferritin n=1 Tax=Chitinophaga arvensicola TaxID=29529 RepID=A0A1I0QIX3_9BACT|nr:ferritin [Chitinophaga arvensicola]SEW26958.1 ferritin [Chitinophaga arvensicola]
MNKNRLSSTLQNGLNKQMTQEALAAQIYLSFGAWASGEGYGGIANFLFRHANEERNHMTKFLEYILERGGKADIEAIPKPPADPTSVQNCFEQVFQQEINNTTGIYKLVKMSFDEEDWATWNFLQWFVREQTEEETLALNLLDKIKVAGGEKATGEALYALDRDLEKEPDEATLAETKTAENP